MGLTVTPQMMCKDAPVCQNDLQAEPDPSERVFGASLGPPTACQNNKLDGLPGVSMWLAASTEQSCFGHTSCLGCFISTPKMLNALSDLNPVFRIFAVCKGNGIFPTRQTTTACLNDTETFLTKAFSKQGGAAVAQCPKLAT